MRRTDKAIQYYAYKKRVDNPRHESLHVSSSSALDAARIGYVYQNNVRRRYQLKELLV